MPDGSIDAGAGPVGGRFDHLPSGSALSFSGPSRVLVADDPADVVPVLCERADEVPVVALPPGRVRGYSVGPWEREWTAEGYRDDVARVRRAIAAGDTYQLNLTVRLRSPFAGDPEQLYADLAWSQRAAYATYLDLGRFVIASASPELFFEWTADRLVTRPMKGTAPRGRSTIEDDAQRRRLLGSEKERAENLMIVDLLRNDLGRIAEVGSVDVPALFTPERYETVWQLTSDVTARPRPGTGLVDVFRALFPSGSVTGAPKQRSMELIRQLEPEPRGVYCGAIGWVAPPGEDVRARFSVAIRTVTVDRASGVAVYGTGGGITWGSAPDAEHAELLTKAAILSEPYEEFALLETMAHLPGVGLRNLDRHLDRLADSAAYFGFPFDRRAAVARLAGVEGSGARVRLVLRRSGAVDVETGPLPPPSDRPVRLALDRGHPVDADQVWLRHKTTRREVYAARAAAHPDADDVVLTNQHGHVTETTIANLAVLLDGRWWTPPVTAGCLPGVERGLLVDSGLLAERELTAEDVERAEGLAVVSSLRGWRPAVLS